MDKKNKFIVLGNTRIKVGNIKSYGISNKKRITHEKIYTRKYTGDIGFLLSILSGGDCYYFEWEGDMVPFTKERARELKEDGFMYRRYRNENGELVDDEQHYLEDDDLIENECNYLYVTTYQNDNFQFFENEVDFDIFKKCSELDNILS